MKNIVDKCSKCAKTNFQLRWMDSWIQIQVLQHLSIQLLKYQLWVSLRSHLRQLLVLSQPHRRLNRSKVSCANRLKICIKVKPWWMVNIKPTRFMNERLFQKLLHKWDWCIYLFDRYKMWIPNLLTSSPVSETVFAKLSNFQISNFRYKLPNITWWRCQTIWSEYNFNWRHRTWSVLWYVDRWRWLDNHSEAWWFWQFWILLPKELDWVQGWIWAS